MTLRRPTLLLLALAAGVAVGRRLGNSRAAWDDERVELVDHNIALVRQLQLERAEYERIIAGLAALWVADAEGQPGAVAVMELGPELQEARENPMEN